MKTFYMLCFFIGITTGLSFFLRFIGTIPKDNFYLYLFLGAGAMAVAAHDISSRVIDKT